MNQNPEQIPRDAIDKQLAACGWAIQDYNKITLRASAGVTKKDRPLTTAMFTEFETCYGKDPNSLPEPQILASDAITELDACVDELQLILDLIEAEEVE